MGRFTALSTFFPGAATESVKPCNGCVRFLGPNSTGCPGCDARIAEEKRSNRKRPVDFFGKIPFGQAGWRVARGRRTNVYPVQLRDYGCFMQQGLRHGTTFYRRTQPHPTSLKNTLLDHRQSRTIIRVDGTGEHVLSGRWERPPKQEKPGVSKYNWNIFHL